MRDCSGNQLIGTQGELGMYRIFQREKQYFKVTAFYALSLSKYHMKCHIHESFEIMYVTSGECRIFCQNEWLRMKSGEFIYILPGVQHQLEITEGRPCSVLNLEFALTSEETAVEAEILLEKIRDFQKCFQMPRHYLNKTLKTLNLRYILNLKNDFTKVLLRSIFQESLARI